MKMKKLIAAAMCLCMTLPTAAVCGQGIAIAENSLSGDVNGDNEFDVADVIALNRYLIGRDTLQNPKNADMNGDGIVNVFDLTLMRRAITEKMSKPVPQGVSARNLAADYRFESPEKAVLKEEARLGQLQFALDILKRQNESDKNVLVSPYSIMQALAMTTNGAKGETRAEMEKALGGISIDDLNKYLYTLRINQPDEENCKLLTANSIWARDDEKLTVDPGFIKKVAGYYDSDYYAAPFDQGTVGDINKWVSDNTGGMIDKLLGKIDDDAMMYLINAVFFDAKWQSQYQRYNVSKDKFTAYDGEQQEAELMHSTEFSYISDDNAKGFLKYYEGRRYAFAAILPDEGTTVDEYIDGLTAQKLGSLLSNVQSRKLYAAIPKFKYDYSTVLNDTLKAMGMEMAFDSRADFEDLGKYENAYLYINNVIHKTAIEVNEAGTKAAAVTAVEMVAGSAYEPDPPPSVILDRPFIYAIVDMENNIPVFMGTLKTLAD